MHTSKKQDFREIVILFALVFLVACAIIFARTLLFGREEDRRVSAIFLLLSDIPSESADTLREGDRVLDRGRRTILGTVEAITEVPHLYETVGGGESVTVEKVGYSDVTLKIRIESENRRNREGGVFYIGSALTISTHALAAEGQIIALEEAKESHSPLKAARGGKKGRPREVGNSSSSATGNPPSSVAKDGTSITGNIVLTAAGKGGTNVIGNPLLSVAGKGDTSVAGNPLLTAARKVRTRIEEKRG